jgi:murein DD-endopeptidase MepM/ murein hydrolase activator NlpD
MKQKRYLTVVLHRDGDVASRSLRAPLWVARTLAVTAAVVGTVLLIAVSLYSPIVRTAARVPGLNREIARLRAENEKVRELAGALEAMEASYGQLQSMLGADVVPVRSRPGAAAVAFPVYASPPASRGPQREIAPLRWPLDDAGFVTRGTVAAGVGEEEHAGLDVAVPVGTPIRAAGDGLVAESTEHPEYGLFVRILHPNGYETMYGHASRLLTVAGDSVRSGQVIALSGSTGRSTAPHLHFEVRRGGRSIDPRNLMTTEQ